MNKIILAITIFVSAFLPVASTTPKPGDVLIYKGAFSTYVPNKLFEHAGIYIGDDYVVEFNGGNKNNGIAPRIVKTSLNDFKKQGPDGKVYIVDLKETYPGIIPFSAEETVDCARHFLYNNGRNFGEYHPFLNNCQHFATYCSIGAARSWQADGLVSVIKFAKKYSPTLNATISYGEHAIDFVMDLIYLSQ